jgi:hypothetical protein
VEVGFDADVWSQEVERLNAQGAMRAAAGRARGELVANGVPRSALRACSPEGGDGTRLPRCLKVYVPLSDRPASERPYALVFELAVGERGAALRFIAFGERHPEPGTRSVYERAHKRLHGRLSGSCHRRYVDGGLDLVAFLEAAPPG